MLTEISLEETPIGDLLIDGRIPCGDPSYPPDGAPRDPLVALLFRDPSKAHVYIADGVSMVGFGVNPGDVVFSEEGIQPNPDDLVIADVEGEGKMLKQFCPPYLIGNNGRKVEVVRPNGRTQIREVVRAVMAMKRGR
jgi:hypothetical protein